MAFFPQDARVCPGRRPSLPGIPGTRGKLCLTVTLGVREPFAVQSGFDIDLLGVTSSQGAEMRWEGFTSMPVLEAGELDKIGLLTPAVKGLFRGRVGCILWEGACVSQGRHPLATVSE